MKKRLISLIVAVVMLFSMLCPAAYADDETVSFDTCTHEWETPIRSGYSYTIPNTDVSFGVKVEQCKKCKWYKHVASIIVAEYTYYSPFNVDENGLIPTELATVWANVWYKTFGKNATATKFTPGGGSTSGGGAGRRPAGYANDNGTPNYNLNGVLQVVVNPIGFHWDNSSYKGAKFGSSLLVSVDVSGSQISSTSNPKWALYAIYEFIAPCDGLFYLGREGCGQKVFTSSLFYSNRWYTQNYSIPNYSGYGLSVSATKGQTLYYVSDALVCSVDGYQRWGAIKAEAYPLVVLCEPLSSLAKQTNITINNNTWNGNIYVDNSNNITYIYPQYTTVNENNETVTNISTNPIIYNNETKQYYTYDQTTKNYYYITYNTQPTPSPSPTLAPTDKPGGSISTPETGEPGGGKGDTTGIVAVLVEIRDNMIQGFLDIKAAFVAGFADLSANFTLAIENLNLNITNIFNKKFPDQSTPETALPSPTPDVSPSPTPSTPETGEPSPSPSPSPTPDPDLTPSPTPAPTSKPDSGDKTNNFWTIIFPNGGGSEDGKKGIFWALVSLILALIAFFANLAVGVGYLFPFLPDGVVMTINTCLIVIFLFTIIKFIMRSK